MKKLFGLYGAETSSVSDTASGIFSFSFIHGSSITILCTIGIVIISPRETDINPGSPKGIVTYAINIKQIGNGTTAPIIIDVITFFKLLP